MRFADRLKELRAKANLTQAELAEKARLPAGTVRNYEQGIRQPNWAKFIQLIRALGVPASAFAKCDEISKESRP